MIIAIANQKGGTGKSTTAQAIAQGVTYKGGKSLIVDLDPQGNTTFSMGGNSGDAGAYELITGDLKPGQIIQTTAQGDIITASPQLAAIDTALTGDAKARVTGLQRALKAVKSRYDVIAIDCPPALNLLLINGIAAADKVIIPLTADIYALQGLYQLVETIRGAQAYNKGLEIAGVLFTRHSTRTIVSRDLTDVIADKCRELHIPVFKTTIREGVAIREAQTQRQNLYSYAPRSNPAQDYSRLLDELGL